MNWEQLLKDMFTPDNGLALLAGLLFGILLQRGHATRYNKILGALRLKDFTIVKIMLAAVLVGLLMLQLFRHLDPTFAWHVKSLAWAPMLVGSVVFGIGFALLGYCPGTAVGAVFEGRLDALFGGLLGMVAGGWAFAELHALFLKDFMEIGDVGKLTFYDIFKDQFGLEPLMTTWIFAGAIFLFLLILHFAAPKDTPSDELI